MINFDQKYLLKKNKRPFTIDYQGGISKIFFPDQISPSILGQK
jgi:hypothetical protein